MEILKVVWLSHLVTTVFGIVIAKNEVGQIHLYIGVVSGKDEKIDTQHILDWGAKQDPKDFINSLTECLNEYGYKF